MNKKKKLSFTYILLRRLGLNYSEEEYGQVSLWKVIKRVVKTYRDVFLLNNTAGLDYFLSSRIRHGTIVNQLRKYFQEKKLKTRKIYKKS